MARVVTEAESKEWLSQRGLLDSNGEVLESEFFHKEAYLLPSSKGRNIALSNAITSYWESDCEALLLLKDYDIWGVPCHHMNLFYGYRCYLGEPPPPRPSADDYRMIRDKPGHILASGDQEIAHSLIALTLYFMWGCVFVTDEKKWLFEISHDELFFFYFNYEHEVPDHRSIFETYDCEYLVKNKK